MEKRMTKIALMENCGADFFYTRLAFAKYLKEKGFEPIAIVPKDDFVEKIENENVHVRTYTYERNSINILGFYKTLLNVIAILRDEKVDILHTFRLQPNVIGTIAGRVSKIPFILNHITGLGFAFSCTSFKYRVLRLILLFLYRLVSFFSKILICQNPEDINTFNRANLNFPMSKFRLVKGSGVSSSFYSELNLDYGIYNKITKELDIEEDQVVFTMVSRLLWQKGVREFVEAFKELNVKFPNIKCLIVGTIDDANPHSVTKQFIEENSDCVNFLGRRKDIKELLAISDVFVLPSYYREGLPRSILEAMAMKKPIITTTMPGCNLTVDDGVNGFLIKPKNQMELHMAMEKILIETCKLEYMGKNSRAKFLREFSTDIIFSEIVNIYLEALSL